MGPALRLLSNLTQDVYNLIPKGLELLKLWHGVCKCTFVGHVYVHAKRALKRLFVKCAFLVLIDSLFHATDDDAII